MPDHHPDSPYNLEGIFEGAKWVLKGTNTSTSKSIAIAMPTASHPGLVPTAAIAMPPPAVKSEPADSATTSTIVSTLEYLEALISAGATNCFHTSLDECHFCDETGHTMVCGCCLQLELYIQQEKCHCNAEGKVVLPSSAMIPNYSGKCLYMKHIDKRHRHNPGQLATRCLTGNANLDAEQALHQTLIHEVLHLDKRESIALQCPDVFDDIAIPCSKGYCPAPLVTPAPATTNSAPAVPSAPTAHQAPEPVSCLAASASVASTSNPQPPVHLFSGNPNCYIPLNTHNFAAPGKHQDVFDCVLQTKIIVSVGELGSLSSDICNQFYNGVTPKHNLATNIAAANKPSEHDTFIEEILPTFTYNNATFNLSSNAATAQGILEMLVLVTAIDPVEAYI
ncbi:hypothetical protein E4T56_gene11877 [Termitomyces sp. T112]|nr:hypothetical protein E4T56_gene11877 [Termitomyces sp. T112]